MTPNDNVGPNNTNAKNSEGVMVVQNPPDLDKGPIEQKNLQENVKRIFQSNSGYRIRYLSYVKSIVIITVIGWVIAFALYTELWIITNESISNMTNGNTTESINTKTNTEISISDAQFWFGVLLISFPTILYSFSLITYLSVLYDSRLAEAVRLFTSDKELKDKFVNIHLHKFQYLKTKKDSKNVLFQSLPSVRDPIFMPPSIFSNHDHQNNLKRAYSTKSQIMTELIQRLAMKMDGSTLTGYLFPVILLQIV